MDADTEASDLLREVLYLLDNSRTTFRDPRLRAGYIVRKNKVKETIRTALGHYGPSDD